LQSLEQSSHEQAVEPSQLLPQSAATVFADILVFTDSCLLLSPHWHLPVSSQAFLQSPEHSSQVHGVWLLQPPSQVLAAPVAVFLVSQAALSLQQDWLLKVPFAYRTPATAIKSIELIKIIFFILIMYLFIGDICHGIYKNLNNSTVIEIIV
jgi:hypothetical protein